MKAAVLQARDSLDAFARLIGFPLLPYQSESLTLESKMTVLVAPRQTGKSYSLSVVALHRAARSRNQRVLVISAGEEAAKRLLRVVAEMAASSSALQGSVLNETASVLTLTNGSEIRSVPASERQIRGWTVDLLIVDEAAYVTDDVLLSAALPTTVARKDSRIESQASTRRSGRRRTRSRVFARSSLTTGSFCRTTSTCCGSFKG